ncbi:hypothetical protein ACP70R_004402 [Stipagrostis hirtigluma subsp. patula]
MAAVARNTALLLALVGVAMALCSVVPPAAAARVGGQSGFGASAASVSNKGDTKQGDLGGGLGSDDGAFATTGDISAGTRGRKINGCDETGLGGLIGAVLGPSFRGLCQHFVNFGLTDHTRHSISG